MAPGKFGDLLEPRYTHPGRIIVAPGIKSVLQLYKILGVGPGTW